MSYVNILELYLFVYRSDHQFFHPLFDILSMRKIKRATYARNTGSKYHASSAPILSVKMLHKHKSVTFLCKKVQLFV